MVVSDSYHRSTSIIGTGTVIYTYNTLCYKCKLTDCGQHLNMYLSIDTKNNSKSRETISLNQLHLTRNVNLTVYLEFWAWKCPRGLSL
jgi:hypothetical protein